MAKVKTLNIVVTFVGTPYVVNDTGVSKSPRFELYNIGTHAVKVKSNNPLDFNEIVFGDDEDVSERPEKAKRRKRNSTATTN